MKRALRIFILIISVFMINMSFVKADETMDDILPSAGGGKVIGGTYYGPKKCGIFGDPDDPNEFAYYLQQVFYIIRFAAPILVILMTIIDLVKVTAEEKQDGELKKIGIKTLKRAIYAVIIFVLPTLITVVFELVGLYGTCVS